MQPSNITTLAGDGKEPPPLAFLSHTSSDNEVTAALDDGLSSRGIKTKLDLRSFDGGTPLAKDIYDDGIAIADATVVVISRVSVTKPWVREELDFATVQRVNRKARVIPFIVDDVPDADVSKLFSPVEHLHWVRLSDYPTVDAAAAYIADIIHGRVKAPEIGPPPAWTKEPIYANIFGLEPEDEVLLKFFCRTVLDDVDHYGRLTLFEYKTFATDNGLSDSSLKASLYALENTHHIKMQFSLGDGGIPPYVQISDFSIFRYMRGYEPSDYAYLRRTIVAACVNGDANSTNKLNLSLPSERGRAVYILKELETQGHIKALRIMHGQAQWFNTPTLARLLEKLS